MKTPLHLCYTAKKGRQRSKNLHRLFKKWSIQYNRHQNVNLNKLEQEIFFYYRDEILIKYGRYWS